MLSQDRRPVGPTSAAQQLATRRPLLIGLESLAVAVSPVVAYFVLRLRAMAPVELPDPSMHTIYILDPSQMFTRYAAAFAATARMREGAQAGFLVLARLCYLAFGVLPGFFVTRYVLALLAVVPAYLLLRRLYGAPAGFMAIAVLLSCPVVITAWGTDYPDSAVVSYVAGGVACLALSLQGRHRRAFLISGGFLLTLAVWSHGMGIMLAATAGLCYLAVCVYLTPRRALLDGPLLGLVALATTFGLMVASRYVLGQFNFITPTIAAARFLDRPDQVRQWHSSNWRWAPHVAYLLVPPSVVVGFFITFARRLKKIEGAALYVGICAFAQLALFSYLQFGYHVQALEMHFFSSTLWGVVCLALALLLAEMAKNLFPHRLWRLAPFGGVLAVALLYETDPHVPAFGWLPTGALLAGVPAVFAAFMTLLSRLRSEPRRGAHFADRVAVPPGQAGDVARHRRLIGLRAAVTVSLVATTGSLLVLNVAPSTPFSGLKGLAAEGIPASNYAGALGGSAATIVDWYAVSSSLPAFVGEPTYKGEQLLMWFPWDQPLLEPVGIFHEGFNSLGPGFPVLSDSDRHKLAQRRPAELLLLSITGAGFGTALRALGTYRPELVRSTVLRRGSAVLYAWLVVLRSFTGASFAPVN